MKGTITRIELQRIGSNGERYETVFIRLTTGPITKTYLCDSYDNYAYWRKALRVGTVIDQLHFKADGLVDADSKPRVLFQPPEQQQLL